MTNYKYLAISFVFKIKKIKMSKRKSSSLTMRSPKKIIKQEPVSENTQLEIVIGRVEPDSKNNMKNTIALPSIPKFKGKSQQEFESWRIRMNIYIKLNAFSANSENEKISIVRLGIIDYNAILIVNKEMNKIKTVNDIFILMEKVYGIRNNTTIPNFNLIQKEQESIDQYYLRVRSNLAVYGDMVVDSGPFKRWLFYHFKNGLKLEIKTKLLRCIPLSIESAYEKAILIESSLGSDMLEEQQDKDNNRTASNQRDWLKTKCFGCNQDGHKFSSCRTTSEEKKNEIREFRRKNAI